MADPNQRFIKGLRRSVESPSAGRICIDTSLRRPAFTMLIVNVPSESGVYTSWVTATAHVLL